MARAKAGAGPPTSVHPHPRTSPTAMAAAPRGRARSPRGVTALELHGTAASTATTPSLSRVTPRASRAGRTPAPDPTTGTNTTPALRRGRPARPERSAHGRTAAAASAVVEELASGVEKIREFRVELGFGPCSSVFFATEANTTTTTTTKDRHQEAHHSNQSPRTIVRTREGDHMRARACPRARPPTRRRRLRPSVTSTLPTPPTKGTAPCTALHSSSPKQRKSRISPPTATSPSVTPRIRPARRASPPTARSRRTNTRMYTPRSALHSALRASTEH